MTTMCYDNLGVLSYFIAYYNFKPNMTKLVGLTDCELQALPWQRTPAPSSLPPGTWRRTVPASTPRTSCPLPGRTCSRMCWGRARPSWGGLRSPRHTPLPEPPASPRPRPRLQQNPECSLGLVWEAAVDMSPCLNFRHHHGHVCSKTGV